VLDRRHRLTTSAGFTRTTRRGRRAGTRTLVVHVLSEPGPGTTHAGPSIGFVVGKSVGNAVTRNRVKRRLRHLVRERLPSLPESSLVVVRALPEAAEASSTDLARDLDKGLRRTLSGSRPRTTSSAPSGLPGESR
jgi:ribonuclease P protein component